MTQIEKNLEKAKIAWCEAMLILGYHIHELTPNLRKIALEEDAISCEDIKNIMKQYNIAAKRVAEKAATIEQFRLLNDIKDGKLSVVSLDGNEVKVTF